MNNYNSSSYYRANPYKDIGYMPPMAQRNRSSPGGSSTLPQGLEYFEHAAKKHYDISYQNQIANDNIFKAPQKMSPLQKEALQRSYFRSLNSQDIEGSSTNTLISKAVKNKMKAQQQLQRRKQIQKQAAEAQRQYQYQQQLNRKKYIEDYHRQVMEQKSQKPRETENIANQRSYNEQSIQNDRKKREAELLRLAQQRKNYAIVDFPSLQQNNKSQVNNNSTVVESKPNFHLMEAEKRKKTERDQYQIDHEKNDSLRYGNNYAAKPNYSNSPNLPQVGNRNNYAESNQYQPNQQNQYQPSQYQSNQHQPSQYQQNQSQQNQNKYQQNYDERYDKPGTGGGIRNKDTYHIIEKDEIRKYENYSLPEYNIGPITQIPNQSNPKEQPQKNAMYNREPNNVQNLRQSQTSGRVKNYNANNYYIDESPPPYVQPFKTRQDLRRHNPTYLSYGSPTFAIASRNVIGN